MSLVCNPPLTPPAPLLTGTFKNQLGQVVTPLWNNGYFNFPNAGIYTATYYKTNATGNCDSCVINFNVTCNPCPSSSSCAVQAIVSAPNEYTVIVSPANNYTLNAKCNKEYSFAPSINCTPPSAAISISQVKMYDATYTTPSWANTFISNNGAGPLSIPANVSGTYSIVYFWGTANNICDSAVITITIVCPITHIICDAACYFGGSITYGLPATTINLFGCNSTIIDLACGAQAQGGVILLCPSAQLDFLPFEVRDDATGNIVPGVNGVNPSFSDAGDYTITYYKLNTANERCDSCKLKFHVTCSPAICCSTGHWVAATSWPFLLYKRSSNL